MSIVMSGKFRQISGTKINGQPSSPPSGDLPIDGLVFDFEVGSGLDLTGTSVNIWVDTTGNYTLTGVGSKPKYVSGDNSVQFNFNQFATFNTTTNIRTLAAVMKYDDAIKAGSGNNMFVLGDETNYLFVSSPPAFIYQISGPVVGSTVYVNNGGGAVASTVLESSLKPGYHVVVMVFSSDLSASYYSNVGRDRIYHEFAGNLKELISWDIALTTQQISDASLYLMNKYSIS